jgi:hypothetical protein
VSIHINVRLSSPRMMTHGAILRPGACVAAAAVKLGAAAVPICLRTADFKSEGTTVVGTAEMGTAVLQELDRLAA